MVGPPTAATAAPAETAAMAETEMGLEMEAITVRAATQQLARMETMVPMVRMAIFCCATQTDTRDHCHRYFRSDRTNLPTT